MSKKKCKSSCPADCAKKTSIGGQALIEGIMMRGPKMSAMAVRNPEGEIILEKWATVTKKRSAFFKLPLIRGIFNFIDSMTAGYKSLMRSAEIAGLEEEAPKKDKIQTAEASAPAVEVKEAEATETAETVEVTEAVEMTEASETVETTETVEAVEQETAPEEKQECKCQAAEEKKDKKAKKDKKEKSEKSDSAFMTAVMLISSVLGVVLAIGLFLLVPTYLFKGMAALAGLANVGYILEPDNAILASLIKSVFEGLLRIVVLVVYMLAVRLMKDIKRTFMYHGAEHKTIFCYESGLELTVENVRKQQRFHPRCGTSFLILMLLVGMIISFFIDPVCLAIFEELPSPVIRTLIKLALLPFTMGVGYELIKIAGRHQNLFTRIISAPGMWLQRVTVLEPTDDMIECAIKAFVEVIPDDNSDNY